MPRTFEESVLYIRLQCVERTCCKHFLGGSQFTSELAGTHAFQFDKGPPEGGKRIEPTLSRNKLHGVFRMLLYQGYRLLHNTQLVDVVIERGMLVIAEVIAQIGAVGSHGLDQIGQRQVFVQVEGFAFHYLLNIAGKGV